MLRERCGTTPGHNATGMIDQPWSQGREAALIDSAVEIIWARCSFIQISAPGSQRSIHKNPQLMTFSWGRYEE